MGNLGIIDVLAIVGAIALIVGVFITKTIPIDAGALVLAFALSAMAYIGIEIYNSWRTLDGKENDTED